MDGLTFDPLQAFADFVMSILQPFIDFILSFFPNGDPAIYRIIDNVGNIGSSSTFNVFYFCDWYCVGLCLQVVVLVAIFVHIVKFINSALAKAHAAVETVPIVE